MRKTLRIDGEEVMADVLKSSPLAIHKASGGGYLLTHVELERVLLRARTHALAVQARRELSKLDFGNPEVYAPAVRDAQERYLEL